MVNRVEISPEVTRLAQHKARANGSSLAQELARFVFEEEVVNLDPELDLIIDCSNDLSQLSVLVQAVGVNDVTVNGRRIDVRAMDPDGRVGLCRALIGTPYLSSGTYVVSMEGSKAGQVVAYIGSGTWLAAEEQDERNADFVYVTVNTTTDFDLGKSLSALCQKVQVKMQQAASSLPNNTELAKFVSNRGQFIMARQKQIFTAICSHLHLRELLEDPVMADESLNKAKITRILTDGAVWNTRVEAIAIKLQPKFSALSRDEIKAHVRKLGEKLGGQPDAPEFRKALLSQLTREQMVRQFAGVNVASVKSVVDQVLSGKPAVEAVKGFVKNRVAVDLAVTIKRQRNRVEGFVAATAEEIGQAFQQLSLQPAYATHSPNPDSGVESINEALALLEAGDLAERVKELDSELAGL